MNMGNFVKVFIRKNSITWHQAPPSKVLRSRIIFHKMHQSNSTKEFLTIMIIISCNFSNFLAFHCTRHCKQPEKYLQWCFNRNSNIVLKLLSRQSFVNFPFFAASLLLYFGAQLDILCQFICILCQKGEGKHVVSISCFRNLFFTNWLSRRNFKRVNLKTYGWIYQWQLVYSHFPFFTQ